MSFSLQIQSYTSYWLRVEISKFSFQNNASKNIMHSGLIHGYKYGSYLGD